jgi:hypothetical protein
VHLMLGLYQFCLDSWPRPRPPSMRQCSCNMCHQKKRGIFFALCISPLLNIHGLMVYCWNFYWSRKIMLKVLLLFQNLYKHLSSIVLMLWTTMNQSFISISSLKVNMLLHVRWQLMPNNRIPTEINSTTSTWLFSEFGQRFKARSVSAINSIPQYPFGSKTSGAPTMQQIFFLG